jgi:hypothetical protein
MRIRRAVLAALLTLGLAGSALTGVTAATGVTAMHFHGHHVTPMMHFHG